MIDLAFTEGVGFTIVHDEPEFADASAFRVEPTGACGFVRDSGSYRALSLAIPEDLRDLLRAATSCGVVRMSGYRLVSYSTVRVTAA